MSTRVVFYNIHEEIIRYIDSAKDEILVAVAWLTDFAIINHLTKKSKNGITVKIIFYDDHINNKNNFTELVNNGALIRCSKNLMHNKFAIIDKKIILNGSYNWTQNANNNYENIQISEEEKELTESFIHEFNNLFNESKSSEIYFKTREILFKEYINSKTYPYKYPCFIQIKNNSSTYFIAILNQQELIQWYIFKNPYIRNKEGGRDITIEKEHYINIYGDTEKTEEFIYLKEKTASILSNKYLYKINDKLEIVSEKIKFTNQLSNNLFFIIENENNYIINSKIEKHKIPNYFHPIKTKKYSNFLILESFNPTYKAISDLNGEIIIPPYYEDINIDNNKITLIEYPIFELGNIINTIPKNLKKIEQIINLKNFQKSDLNIFYNPEHTLQNNQLENFIYLSEKSGKWAEIYITLKNTIKQTHKDDFLKIKSKFDDVIIPIHNKKDIINKIKIEIETKKSEREKIYLQKRKEYNDKEFNKLLTMAIISLLGMIFITLSGC